VFALCLAQRDDAFCVQIRVKAGRWQDAAGCAGAGDTLQVVSSDRASRATAVVSALWQRIGGCSCASARYAGLLTCWHHRTVVHCSINGQPEFAVSFSSTAFRAFLTKAHGRYQALWYFIPACC